MEKIILAFPAVLGLILIITGAAIMLRRKKSGISVTGQITDIARTQRKYSRVNINLEAPVVRYEINGETITAVSDKFFTEGTVSFKRGKPINIRVSRSNSRKFVPEDSGGETEKILISCGIMMIVACGVMIFRYF